MTRLVIPVLLIHMLIVSLPLFLVRDMAWSGTLTPTIEGQYIIKNLAVIALALAIAAQLKPLAKESKTKA